MMETTDRVWEKKKVEYYIGSLDFPCHFCELNSYRNFHFMVDDKLFMVVCESCLDNEKINSLKKLEKMKK